MSGGDSWDELRDALAALYADGNQAGAEHAADIIAQPPHYDVVMDARFEVRNGGAEYFLAEWPAAGERTEWSRLQRVLDAVRKITAESAA